MGAKTLISPEEYLRTHYEWEPEYVRGELRERPMPNLTHAEIVSYLILTLARFLGSRGFRAPVSELRCKMPNGNYRLLDVALLAPNTPREELPTVPPLVVVEVLG